MASACAPRACAPRAPAPTAPTAPTPELVAKELDVAKNLLGANEALEMGRLDLVVKLAREVLEFPQALAADRKKAELLVQTACKKVPAMKACK